jgi:hypothetical protein
MCRRWSTSIACNCSGTPVAQPEEFHVQGVEGAREPHDFDEEWGATAKIQAHMPTKVMDDGVQVAQMLDDLFVPRDVEDLVTEAAGTNIGDAEALAMEVVGTNIGSGVDGINIVNMVQQAFSIMEQLAAIPKSMPK